ncbi:MAG TPA: hypothetical protein VF381_01470 [Thermoanaerobaculia bacterium]
MLLTIIGVIAAMLAKPIRRTKTPEQPARTTTDSQRDAAAQFCSAEYTVISSKIQLWMTLQYTWASLVVLILSLLAQLWKGAPVVTLIWLGELVVAVAYWAYQNVMLEGLRAVLYIEEELRPRAAMLTGSDSAFGWERFLRRRRKPNVSQSGLIPPVVSIALPLAFLTYRLLSWSWTTLDIVATVLVLTAAINVTILTGHGMQLWRHINAAVDRRSMGDSAAQ